MVEQSDATETLADYAEQIESGPVVVTRDGRPIAALVPIENADAETVSLSNNPKFLAILERSRARLRSEGGIPIEEMRRRFE